MVNLFFHVKSVINFVSSMRFEYSCAGQKEILFNL